MLRVGRHKACCTSGAGVVEHELGAEGEAGDEVGRVGGGDGRGIIPEEAVDDTISRRAARYRQQSSGLPKMRKHPPTTADWITVGEGPKRSRQRFVTLDPTACGDGRDRGWRKSRHRLVTVDSGEHGYMSLLLIGEKYKTMSNNVLLPFYRWCNLGHV